MNLEPGIGVTTGMAWTAVGGVTLQIESVRMPGSGHLILTGQMGDVMKESAQTAMGYIKSLSEKYGLDASVFKDNDIQIHIPEGATPKDGPSAGVTMCTALFSLLSGKKARRDIAMTGEITLQGNILPVGGIKEKVLAAYQQGIRKILLPKDNAADIEEIPKSVRSRLEFVLLEKAEDAFREVLISEESYEIAFAGRSNVGKSSLLNLLTGRKALARVSGSPGKTRTINFYLVNDDFRIVDLPGYGYAKLSRSETEKWGAMMEAYLSKRPGLLKVVQLVDIRHEPSAQDVQMYDYLRYYGLDGVVVATKADKISKNQQQKSIRQIRQKLNMKKEDAVIPVSALKRTGQEELLDVIESILNKEGSEDEHK